MTTFVLIIAFINSTGSTSQKVVFRGLTASSQCQREALRLKTNYVSTICIEGAE